MEKPDMRNFTRLIVLLASVALVASACGGGSGEGTEVASVSDLESASEVDPLAAAEDLATEPAAEDAPVDVEQAMLDFTECMRENGVEMDDPSVDADGNLRLGRPGRLAPEERADRAVIESARQACSEYLEGITLGFQERDRTEIEDTLVEYAACMRDNGFDMPDPDFSSFGPGQGGGGGGPFGAVDRDDPDFVTADEACRDIFTNAGFDDGRRPGFGRGPGGGE